MAVSVAAVFMVFAGAAFTIGVFMSGGSLGRTDLGFVAISAVITLVITDMDLAI